MGAAAAARRVKHWENILEQQTRITHTSGRLTRSARRSPPPPTAHSSRRRHAEARREWDARQRSEPHSHRPPCRHCTRRPSHPAAAAPLPAPSPRPPCATARAVRCNHHASCPRLYPAQTTRAIQPAFALSRAAGCRNSAAHVRVAGHRAPSLPSPPARSPIQPYPSKVKSQKCVLLFWEQIPLTNAGEAYVTQ